MVILICSNELGPNARAERTFPSHSFQVFQVSVQHGASYIERRLTLYIPLSLRQLRKESRLFIDSDYNLPNVRWHANSTDTLLPIQRAVYFESGTRHFQFFFKLGQFASLGKIHAELSRRFVYSLSRVLVIFLILLSSGSPF